MEEPEVDEGVQGVSSFDDFRLYNALWTADGDLNKHALFRISVHLPTLNFSKFCTSCGVTECTRQ